MEFHNLPTFSFGGKSQRRKSIDRQVDLGVYLCMTVSFLATISDSLCFRRATQAIDDEVWKINIESKMNVIVVEIGLIIESG